MFIFKKKDELKTRINQIKRILDDLQRLKGSVGQLKEMKGRVNANLSRMASDKSLLGLGNQDRSIVSDSDDFLFEIEPIRELVFPWDNTNLITYFDAISLKFRSEHVAGLTNGKFLSMCKFVTIGTKLFILGGENEGVLSSHAFQLETKSKSIKILENMPYPSIDFGLVRLGESIMIAGGRNSTNKSYILSPKEGKWNFLGKINQSRSNPGVAVVNQIVYLIGGTKEEFGAIEKFSKSEGWVVLNLANTFISRSFFGVRLFDSKLELIGGLKGGKETSDIDELTVGEMSEFKTTDRKIKYETCFINSFLEVNGVYFAFDIDGNIHAFEGNKYAFYDLEGREELFAEYI